MSRDCCRNRGFMVLVAYHAKPVLASKLTLRGLVVNMRWCSLLRLQINQVTKKLPREYLTSRR